MSGWLCEACCARARFHACGTTFVAGASRAATSSRCRISVSSIALGLTRQRITSAALRARLFIGLRALGDGGGGVSRRRHMLPAGVLLEAGAMKGIRCHTSERHHNYMLCNWLHAHGLHEQDAMCLEPA